MTEMGNLLTCPSSLRKTHDYLKKSFTEILKKKKCYQTKKINSNQNVLFDLRIEKG